MQHKLGQIEPAGWKKNPRRRRTPMIDESSLPELGPPPERLPAEVRPFWDELVDAAGGILKRPDRWCVEIAARLMERASVNAITATEMKVLNSLLGAMGLLPKRRLKAAPKKPRSVFDELKARKPS